MLRVKFIPGVLSKYFRSLEGCFLRHTDERFSRKTVDEQSAHCFHTKQWNAGLNLHSILYNGKSSFPTGQSRHLVICAYYLPSRPDDILLQFESRFLARSVAEFMIFIGPHNLMNEEQSLFSGASNTKS